MMLAYVTCATQSLRGQRTCSYFCGDSPDTYLVHKASTIEFSQTSISLLNILELSVDDPVSWTN